MKQTPPEEESADTFEFGETLSYEQARALGESLCRGLGGNEELIGDLFLAFRSLAMRNDRMKILHGLERGLIPFCPGVGAIINCLIAARSDEFERRIPNRQ
jgi:hypothetical protein